jgi:serine/threonine protein kinase
MDPLVGVLFDNRFRIIAELGDGRWSTVYKASDVVDNREVALRIVHPKLTANPKTAPRFQAECERLLTLRDPHIIATRAAGDFGGLLFVASDLVHGPRLSDSLYKVGALAWIRAVEIVAQLCSAIRSANAHGVFGPITPEHVYLEPPVDQVRLDVSPRMYTPIDIHRGLRGEWLGPFEFMSPEQLHNTLPDARSDVFSIGVLAYEMITGQLPFTDDVNPAKRILAQRAGSPVPPSSAPLLRALSAKLPAELDAVILRCLELDPADRYPDVTTLRDEILAARMLS